MIDEIAKNPAPAKNKPNWRRDRCEKNIDCGSGDEAGGEGAAGCDDGFDIVLCCRNAI
jgi:hypothetical protein